MIQRQLSGNPWTLEIAYSDCIVSIARRTMGSTTRTENEDQKPQTNGGRRARPSAKRIV